MLPARFQDLSESTPGASGTPNELPRQPQGAPGSLQDMPKRSPRGLQRPSRGFQENSKRLPEAAGTRPEWTRQEETRGGKTRGDRASGHKTGDHTSGDQTREHEDKSRQIQEDKTCLYSFFCI